MSSLREIYQRDAATYYRGGPEQRISRSPAICVSALIALVIAFVVQVASNDFLAGALSAQAILVGFSFNVLFYLVANRLTTPARWTSIDHELRFERLSKLSDKIFDNVTYFNVVAIASAVACLALLLIGSDAFIANVVRGGKAVAAQLPAEWNYVDLSGRALRTTVLAALIFLLIESIATFVRTVTRVRFYFTMLKTMNDAASTDSLP